MSYVRVGAQALISAVQLASEKRPEEQYPSSVVRLKSLLLLATVARAHRSDVRLSREDCDLIGEHLLNIDVTAG